MTDAVEPEAPRPKRRSFMRKARDPKLSDQHVKRQSLITHLAFTLLGGRDEAVSFLNTHNDTLGGRPLDRAMTDDAGYAEVARAIQLLSEPVSGRPH